MTNRFEANHLTHQQKHSNSVADLMNAIPCTGALIKSHFVTPNGQVVLPYRYIWKLCKNSDGSLTVGDYIVHDYTRKVFSVNYDGTQVLEFRLSQNDYVNFVCTCALRRQELYGVPAR